MKDEIEKIKQDIEELSVEELFNRYPAYKLKKAGFRNATVTISDSIADEISKKGLDRNVIVNTVLQTFLDSYEDNIEEKFQIEQNEVLSEELTKLEAIDNTKPSPLQVNVEEFTTLPIVDISTRRQSAEGLGEGSVRLDSGAPLNLDLTLDNATSAVKGDQWLVYYQVCKWIDTKEHDIQVVRFNIGGKASRTLRGAKNLWIPMYMVTENPFNFKVEIIGLADKLKSVEQTLEQNHSLNLGVLMKTQEEKDLDYDEWMQYRKSGVTYANNQLNGQLQPLEKYLAQYDALVWAEDLDEIANKEVYEAYRDEEKSGSRIKQLERENAELKEMLQQLLDKMD